MDKLTRVALFIFAGLLAATAGDAAEHPTLVDVSSTNCTDCHDDLWPAAAAVHPPVEDDCTICHDFSRDEDGMQVGLTEEGTGLCLMCHDEMTAAAEADLDVPHFPVTDSCTTCHNPHGSEQAKLVRAPLTELCGDCHDMDDLNEVHGGQLISGIRCQSCHEVHGGRHTSMLLSDRQHAPFAEGSCTGCHREPMGGRIRTRRRGEKLCLSCHGNLLTEGAQPHEAIFARGDLQGCLGCHDPHMSPNGRLLRAPGPEVCRTCHAENVDRAMAEGGHPPAADDCTSCHLPHDSEHPKLLIEPREELCAVCHDTDDEGIRAAHLGADLAALDCLGCHNPHGSEHDRLLADNVHPPILDGCDTCHDESFDRWYEEGNALCEMCHDDVVEASAAAPVPHAAIELGSCTGCHNPHASPQEKLVKSPGAGPCAECHDDMVPGEGEVGHLVIDLLGCRACHEPHGSENEKLLRESGNELCLSCHDKKRFDLPADAETATYLDKFEVPAEVARRAAALDLQGSGGDLGGHPAPGHRTLGTPTEKELKMVDTTFSGEMTCRTCHNPHKGRDSRIFVDGAKGHEICLKCHNK